MRCPSECRISGARIVRNHLDEDISICYTIGMMGGLWGDRASLFVKLLDKG